MKRIFIGICILLFFAGYAYVVMQQTAEAERKESEKKYLEKKIAEDQLLEKIKIYVSHDTKSCSKEFPLSIYIFNETDKIIDKIHFELEAYEIGHSSNIIKRYDNNFLFDLIISPKSSGGLCWKPRELKRKTSPEFLLYKAVHQTVQFRGGEMIGYSPYDFTFRD